MVFLTGCTEDESDFADQKNQQPEKKKENVTTSSDQRRVLATNLQEPWEIEVVDDRIYISERTGHIVTVKEGKVQRKPVEFAADLSQQSEAGLLGLAFPEDFSSTQTAFAYYSYEKSGAYFQRVVKIEEKESNWIETERMIDEIPGGEYHQGGRLEIGPDNRLYITTGDATNPELAQSKNSLAGKILRMELNGTVPEDNPFGNSYVYSYGHRNPQGLAWDVEGQLYATEHGSDAHDEINHIKAGNNYGWPIIQGDEAQDGMEQPIVHSNEQTWAPSGMANLHGNFYFASLRGEALRQFNPMTGSEVEVISDIGRIRDVFADQHGLYVITNNTDGRGSPSQEDDKLIYITIPENQLHQ